MPYPDMNEINIPDGYNLILISSVINTNSSLEKLREAMLQVSTACQKFVDDFQLLDASKLVECENEYADRGFLEYEKLCPGKPPLGDLKAVMKLKKKVARNITLKDLRKSYQWEGISFLDSMVINEARQMTKPGR